MKRYFLHFLFLALATLVFGQGKVADDISTLLQAGKLVEAEELTNRYLLEDPANVDAIMMKGNVLLNKHLVEQQALLSVLPNFDESVYSTEIGSIESTPVVVPEPLAKDISRLWLAALKLDPTREDIYLGLATLYSWSGMKPELLDLLPVLKIQVSSLETPYYSFADYALNLKDRDDFEGAMEVYKVISGLFPEVPGLLGDIAGEYFFAGQTDSALYYVNLALQNKEADEMTLGNSFFIRSLSGDYDGALEALRRMTGNDHLFYEGLLKFYRNEKKWEKPVEKFLESGPGPADSAAAALMIADTFRLNLDTYLQFEAFDLGDAFNILIHQKFRALRHFIPWFKTAETYCYHQLYPQAAEAFRQLEGAGLDMEPEDRENIDFYYGWTLHQLGDQSAALTRWEKLLDSGDFYKQSAACWFTGKYYFDRDEKVKARDYFSKVAGRASESKYATMCWNYMGID